MNILLAMQNMYHKNYKIAILVSFFICFGASANECLKIVANCKTTELQQNTSDLTKLMQDALHTQKNIDEFLQFIKIQFPNSQIIIPQTKGIKTINALLKTRWGGDASKITDYARATISFDNIYEMYHGLLFIQNSGLIILDIKDNFWHPLKEGYRDINITFKDLSNGHLAEIQLTTHPLLKYKNDTGHHLFDKLRTIKANVIIEKRELSNLEKIEIDKLEKESQIGYKTALLNSI